MSETESTEPRNGDRPDPEQSGPGKRRRQGPPAWGVVLFLVLMGGLLLVNQWISRSGPPVEWIEGDLEAALAQAKKENTLVFLYLYEPGDPIAERNRRKVFTQRWAREPLAELVCCRVELNGGELLGVKYDYKGEPAFRLLDAHGNRVSGSDGAITEGRFWTTITDPASRHP